MVVSWFSRLRPPRAVHPTSLRQSVRVESSRFDGLNDNLYVTSAIQSTGGEVSVFVVAQREGGLDAQLGGTNARVLGSSEFDLLSGSVNGFAPKIFKFSDANKTILSVKLGREDLTQSDFFKGDIAEVLIFNRYLRLSESQKVEGYLAHKWRATDTLVPASLQGNCPGIRQQSVSENRCRSRWIRSNQVESVCWVSGCSIKTMPVIPRAMSTMARWSAVLSPRIRLSAAEKPLT